MLSCFGDFSIKGVNMSRAFMKESDGMFHCNKKDRDCPDANLRGGCDLERCRYENEIVNKSGNRMQADGHEEVH